MYTLMQCVFIYICSLDKLNEPKGGVEGGVGGGVTNDEIADL